MAVLSGPGVQLLQHRSWQSYLNIPVYKFGVETSVMDPTFKGRLVDFWTGYMQEIDRRR